MCVPQLFIRLYIFIVLLSRGNFILSIFHTDRRHYNVIFDRVSCTVTLFYIALDAGQGMCIDFPKTITSSVIINQRKTTPPVIVN